MRRRHLIVAACMLLLAGTSLSQMKIRFRTPCGYFVLVVSQTDE